MSEASDDFTISLEERVQHVRDTLTPPYITMLRGRATERLGMDDLAADRLVDTAISNFVITLDDHGFAKMLGYADIRAVVNKDLETRVIAAQEHR